MSNLLELKANHRNTMFCALEEVNARGKYCDKCYYGDGAAKYIYCSSLCREDGEKHIVECLLRDRRNSRVGRVMEDIKARGKYCEKCSYVDGKTISARLVNKKYIYCGSQCREDGEEYIRECYFRELRSKSSL